MRKNIQSHVYHLHPSLENRMTLPKVDHVPWGHPRVRLLTCKSCCSVGRRRQLEGTREEVETSPSPFSSAVFRLVKLTVCLQFGLCLTHATAPKWTVLSHVHVLPGSDAHLIFLRVVSLNRFSATVSSHITC